MEKKLEKVKEILKKNNQEHLLLNFERLDDTKKEELLNEILNVDFNQMKRLYENVGKNVANDAVVEPISYVNKNELSKEDKEKYFKIGEETIKNGKLAVVTMAGGQGTRLRT